MPLASLFRTTLGTAFAAMFCLCSAAAPELPAQTFPRRDRARLFHSSYEFRLDANGNGAWWWTKDTAASPPMTLVARDGFVFEAAQEVAAFFGGSWLGAPGWESGPVIPGQPAPTVHHAGRFSDSEWLALRADERAALLADMSAWPVSFGAPWTDANQNGVYDPDIANFPAFTGDAPLVIGDEALWTVTRDGGEFAERHWGQRAAGLEFRHLAWAMAGEGCPDRVVIQRLRVINRAGGLMKEVRLGLFAEAALGDATDDLVGVDTVLGLAYVWNSGDTDPLIGDPPAVGYLLLQGVAEAAPGERGLFDLSLREGIRNQPPSAFTFFSHDTHYQRVPDPASTQLPLQLRAALRGLRADGSEQRDPATGEATRFAAAGNPMRQSGWVDGVQHAAGGRVLLFSFGPFMLAQGDTQEVVFARIGAQGGPSSAADVQALLDYALCVSQHYAAQFTTSASPLRSPADFAITAAWPQPLPRHATVMQLRIDMPRPAALTVRWHDVLGRRVLESRHEAAAGRLLLTVPSPRHAGVYLVEVSDGASRAVKVVVVEQ